MIGVLLQYVKHYTGDVKTELMIIIRYMKWQSTKSSQKYRFDIQSSEQYSFQFLPQYPKFRTSDFCCKIDFKNQFSPYISCCDQCGFFFAWSLYQHYWMNLIHQVWQLCENLSKLLLQPSGLSAHVSMRTSVCPSHFSISSWYQLQIH